MRVERFAYDLPPELVAQEPAAERELARLMIVREDDIIHAQIADLAAHVPAGSLVVLNDTKVIHARILGTKEASGGKAEVFLVRREKDPDTSDHGERWRAMTR